MFTLHPLMVSLLRILLDPTFHILSQFISAPTQIHYSHFLRILRYLRGTRTRRLFFPRSSSLQLQAYCDAT
jgi:hypothetical protein